MLNEAKEMGLNHVAIVIPSYKTSMSTPRVVENCLDAGVGQVIVVDDSCPDGSGEAVQTAFGTNLKVKVLFNSENLGVGGATKNGYLEALKRDKTLCVVKVDSDGQMDLGRLASLVAPVVSGECEYSKGNRFNRPRDLRSMPKVRVFGNAVLTLVNKISSGYWSISDPTNGYTCISREALQELELDKIHNRYFFESDMLFRLRLQQARVKDVSMPAVYGDEKSSLKISKVLFQFPFLHSRNHLKRLVYQYLIREWSIGTFLLPLAIFLSAFGLYVGLDAWFESMESGLPSNAGTVILATFPLLVAVQFLLTFLETDIRSEPS